METELKRQKPMPITNLKRKIEPLGILAIVADYFNCTPEEIMGKSRVMNIALARHVARFVYSKLTGGITSTALVFSGDHSTIIHSIKAVNNLYETDKVFKRTYNEIENEINTKLKTYEAIRNNQKSGVSNGAVYTIPGIVGLAMFRREYSNSGGIKQQELSGDGDSKNNFNITIKEMEMGEVSS